VRAGGPAVKPLRERRGAAGGTFGSHWAGPVSPELARAACRLLRLPTATKAAGSATGKSEMEPTTK
jgi:hypothetical protein